MARRPDPHLLGIVRSALELADHGDLPAAWRTARTAIEAGDTAPVLYALAGMLACRAGDPEAGIVDLRFALDASPDDNATRGNLVQALIDTGRQDEAWTTCSAAAASSDPTLRLWRLRGHLAQERKDRSAAIDAYRRIVAKAPSDFQSWNNLGNAYALDGDTRAAVEALGRAVGLRPDLVAIRVNHAVAVGESGRRDEAVDLLQACLRDDPDEMRVLVELGAMLAHLHREEEASRVFERAIALRPDDPDLHVWLGQQRVALIDLSGAEAAFKQALRIAPDHAEAHVQLGLLYDYANRQADLRSLVENAEAIAVDPAVRDFLRGLDLLRAGAFDEALSALRRVPDDREAWRRDMLIGQCQDRLGDTAAAFAAFRSMNRRQAADPTDPPMRAGLYRDQVARDLAQATPEWFERWRPVDLAGESPPDPVFLVGFPRSGTTLLDTLLMGHRGATVMEELPILRAAQDALPADPDIATLDAAAIRIARARYFERARSLGGWDGRTTLIDKMPLNLNKVPLIHRLFPKARFILALRHPCDVVLSCYMTTFVLNNAMANFLDLATTAELYDLSFGFWSRCREALPLPVHTVVYERVVADAATELRSVTAFLGLEWQDSILDHRATLARRAPVATASYAQVGEPLYTRSAGRWRRYASELDMVLPILVPWIARLGYAETPRQVTPIAS